MRRALVTLNSHPRVRRSANLPTTRGELILLQPKIDQPGGLGAWERAVHSDDQLIVLDLFCGAGGLSVGFREVGFFIAAGIDSDARAAQTHAGNFLSKSIQGDLKGVSDTAVGELIHDRLEIPRVDVIVAGPPCQGFAGVARAKIRSLDEVRQRTLTERNHLYREFVQFVAKLRPGCFVMENVPHLASYGQGRIDALIREDFDRIGYDIGTVDQPGQPILLEAAAYGVPQTRRRLFYLGFRRSHISRVHAPRPTHNARMVQSRTRYVDSPEEELFSVGPGRLHSMLLPAPRTVADAIGDLPALRPPALQHLTDYEGSVPQSLLERGALRDSGYRELMRADMTGEQAKLLYDHVVRPVRQDDAEAFRHMPEGGTYLDVPPEYRRYRLEDEHFEDRYCRLLWDQPSRAVTAHIAKDGYWYIHPDIDQGRTLSVREVARLQSFPDSFRFAGHRTSMYRQIGNAVPPLLARAIAERIRQAVERGATSWVPAERATQAELPLNDFRDGGLSPIRSGDRG